MKALAEKLEMAGQWAAFPALLLVFASGATRSGALLAASFFFLAPAFLMPSIADWLRTRAALAEIRSHHRAMAAGASTLPPPPPVGPAILRDLGWDQESDDRPNLSVEWDSPSRSIH